MLLNYQECIDKYGSDYRITIIWHPGGLIQGSGILVLCSRS